MAHDESHTCACGGACGCQDSHEEQNTYVTREEYIVQLERYLVDLKAEIAAVELELQRVQSPGELVKA